MIGVLNKNSSQGVLIELLSECLVKSMGKNCISLMTTSGAKGSKVIFCFSYFTDFIMAIVRIIYCCLLPIGKFLQVNSLSLTIPLNPLPALVVLECIPACMTACGFISVFIFYKMVEALIFYLRL